LNSLTETCEVCFRGAKLDDYGILFCWHAPIHWSVRLQPRSKSVAPQRAREVADRVDPLKALVE